MLKYINPEWAEKCSGYRKITKVPIRSVSVVTSCEAETDDSISISMSPNLSSTPEVKITKSVNKNGEEVTEKEFKKQVQVKQVIKKLHSGSAEAYLRWKMWLDHVLKNCPCESGKEKFDIAEAILDEDLFESCKLWRENESSEEKAGIFKEEKRLRLETM